MKTCTPTYWGSILGGNWSRALVQSARDLSEDHRSYPSSNLWTTFRSSNSAWRNLAFTFPTQMNSELKDFRCVACGCNFRKRRDRVGTRPFCTLTCRRSRAGEIARLLSFTDASNTAQCWIWRGKIAKTGYGVFCQHNSHRRSYQLFVGEVPAGLSLDHLCRVRSCCNPFHLEPVTLQENLRRGREARSQ